MAAITSGLSDQLFFNQHRSTKYVHLFFSVAPWGHCCVLAYLNLRGRTVQYAAPWSAPPPFFKILDFPRHWQMVDWVLNTSYYYCCWFWTLQTSTIAWWQCCTSLSDINLRSRPTIYLETLVPFHNYLRVTLTSSKAELYFLILSQLSSCRT